MKERLIKLLEVKSLVTLMLVSAAVIGFFKGLLTSEMFTGWVGMVLVYFFTKDKKEGL